MVHLVERVVALRQPNLKRVIGGLQNSYYQEWTGMGESQLTVEELDCYETPEEAAYRATKVFYHPSAQLAKYPLQVGEALTVALSALGVASVYGLTGMRTPWLGDPENGYPLLQKAYQHLRSITKDTLYREGFRVELGSLAGFMEIIFWMSRCDPAAPEYIFLNPDNDSFVSYFCKYGNLHTEFFDPFVETEVCRRFTEAGLIEWQGQEYDRLSKNGVIKGRKIKV